MRKINKTQAKIIAASKEEYALNGYSSTSFQAIAERSGTSKSLINYYFPKKQDILVTALGIHLEEISDYVSSLKKYDSLMRFFLVRVIYYQSFREDKTWVEFDDDIQERTEKDLNTYRNHFPLFESIAEEFPVNLDKDELFVRSIAIYGLTRQLVASFLRGELDITYEQMIEQMLWDTSCMLQLNNYTVYNYMGRIWEEYESLERKEFLFFNP
ncbi:MAG: TetR/AcrR family transcriptional regulator [Eubacteriaceae bacterium]|nr:TetR/AcrR family transcriptional regulator [Eubacteriaceae bacterium]